MMGFFLWAEAVQRDLIAAGFAAVRIDGLPFVQHGNDFWQTGPQLLAFTPSVPVERFFYRGGTLYVPVGIAALRKGTPIS